MKAFNAIFSDTTGFLGLCSSRNFVIICPQKINLYILSGFPEHRVQLMRLYMSQQKSQKGKEGFKVSERWMSFSCVAEKPEIKLYLEQDTKWWKT